MKTHFGVLLAGDGWLILAHFPFSVVRREAVLKRGPKQVNQRSCDGPAGTRGLHFRTGLASTEPVLHGKRGGWGYRKTAASGSYGRFYVPWRALWKRVMCHLCGIKELGCALFEDELGHHSIGDAGDEVADVAGVGERGQGLAKGFVGAQEGDYRVIASRENPLMGAVEGVATASDGGVGGAGDESCVGVRRG